VDAPAEPALEETVRRAQTGDPAAFRRFVDATHGRVFRLALRLLGSDHDAEDVAQETYVRAWSGIRELREPGAALGWLLQITRNAARDRMRSGERRRTQLVDEAAIEPLLARLATPLERPDEALAGAQLGAAIQQALEGIPEKHRVVLLLREVDGMSYEEIAQALGIPVGTIESRLHRARKAMAEKLTRQAKRAR
jgi:RNA polymerase sigma-70 factor, ECF subfamily